MPKEVLEEKLREMVMEYYLSSYHTCFAELYDNMVADALEYNMMFNDIPLLTLYDEGREYCYTVYLNMMKIEFNQGFAREEYLN